MQFLPSFLHICIIVYLSLTSTIKKKITLLGYFWKKKKILEILWFSLNYSLSFPYRTEDLSSNLSEHKVFLELYENRPDHFAIIFDVFGSFEDFSNIPYVSWEFPDEFGYFFWISEKVM